MPLWVKDSETKFMPKKILVTGAAGFIGSHLAVRLLDRGDTVVGLDNLNNYYDVTLKEARLALLSGRDGFTFVKAALEDQQAMSRLFEEGEFDVVVNLAAQAGVRYSLDNPLAYVISNQVGFAHILEGCRHTNVKHLVFASSSSVYGANRNFPFSEARPADHPVSLYAATKKSNELMAHAYAHLFGLACTGLRFFTVYGPWGRPDMALFLFTKAILEGKPINVFNQGQMQRDFTYIDDIIEGVVRVIDKAPTPDPAWRAEEPSLGTSYAPYRIYNIGNGHPEELPRMIEALEETLGAKAEKNFLPMQQGDVQATAADIGALNRDFDFSPKTSIEEGIPRFVKWYREYYRV
jgi:UDP-glucuronate 4-epimerase